MKANEFVKKFGWEKAKEALNRVAWCEGSYCTKLNHGCIKNNHECCVDVDDLKRLVESHELVESLGGLDEARKVMGEILAQPNHKYKANFEKPVLTQAIADVESCQ